MEGLPHHASCLTPGHVSHHPPAGMACKKPAFPAAVRAEVVYKVKAVIHTAGTFKSKIKGKQHLAVTQREYVPPKPAIASGVSLSVAAPAAMAPCGASTMGFASATIAGTCGLMHALPPPLLQETPMMVCWCFNKGHASANIAVDRDRYMPGETANIILQADNQSSERFTSVDVSWGAGAPLYQASFLVPAERPINLLHPI